jgi:hypothetical protein
MHVHGDLLQVVKQAVSIKLVPGGKYQLITGEHESYLMDAADWELRPASIEQIVPTVSMLAHAGGGGRMRGV